MTVIRRQSEQLAVDRHHEDPPLGHGRRHEFCEQSDLIRTKVFLRLARRDLQSDIAAWATEILNHYRTPVNAALLRAGVGAAGEVESDCLRGHLDEARRIVERARLNAPVNTQDVIDGVLAPVMYRIIFLPFTLSDDYAQLLTDRLFATGFR